MLRVGIIGTGSSAENHLKALNSSDKFLVVGFLSSDNNRRNTFSLTNKIKGFIDTKLFFETLNLNLVVICNPNHLHSKYANIALQYKIPTLIDKPIDSNLIKSKKIVRDFHKERIPLFVGLQKRFDEATNYLKQNLNHEIGNLLFINLNINMYRNVDYFSKKPWILNKENSKFGIIIHLGIHAFDQVNWIINKKVKQVFAISFKKNKSFDFDDTYSGIIKYDKNIYLNFNFTISNNNFQKNKFEFVGNKSSLILINDKIYKLAQNNSILLKKSFSSDKLGTYKNFYEDIYLSLTHQHDSKISASSILDTEKLIHRITSSTYDC